MNYFAASSFIIAALCLLVLTNSIRYEGEKICKLVNLICITIAIVVIIFIILGGIIQYNFEHEYLSPLFSQIWMNPSTYIFYFGTLPFVITLTSFILISTIRYHYFYTGSKNPDLKKFLKIFYAWFLLITSSLLVSIGLFIPLFPEELPYALTTIAFIILFVGTISNRLPYSNILPKKYYLKLQTEKLIKIIQCGEGELVEFKSCLPKKRKKIGKKFSGMINRALLNELYPNEVFLFFGINDDKSVCGIDVVVDNAFKRNIIKKKNKQEFQRWVIQMIKDHTDPKIIPHSEFFFREGKEILVISYEIGKEQILVTYDDVYYVTTGDNLETMPSKLLSEFYRKKSPK